jgi:hypothetical protein
MIYWSEPGESSALFLNGCERAYLLGIAPFLCKKVADS